MKKFLLLALLAIFIVGCSAPIDTDESFIDDEPASVPTQEEPILDEESVENSEVNTQSSEEDVELDEQDAIEEEALGISRDELAQNSNANSCWVAYQGKVYDLTDWLRQHPGGAQAILPNCGTAEQFEEAYNARHGERDSGLLRNAPIGDFSG